METRVWDVLQAQGRMILWLADQTGISKRRLYGLKNGQVDWWLFDEAQSVSRILGMPFDYLFPAGSRVLPEGRKRPILEEATA